MFKGETWCSCGPLSRSTPPADIGNLRPLWDGPIAATACQSPNAYMLALPRRMQCSSTVNVDRLKPLHERVDRRSSSSWPVSDPGQEGGLLLNRRDSEIWGVTRYLMRCQWRGHKSADDEWLLLEELHWTDKPRKVAEYEASAAAARPDSASAVALAPLPRRCPLPLPLWSPATGSSCGQAGSGRFPPCFSAPGRSSVQGGATVRARPGAVQVGAWPPGAVPLARAFEA